MLDGDLTWNIIHLLAFPNEILKIFIFNILPKWTNEIFSNMNDAKL